MSVLIMDQKRSGLPVVEIVNPKTGNTKLIINEIDFVPGKHVFWNDFLEAKNNVSEETDIVGDGDGGEVVIKEEPSAAIKRERAARSQKEKEPKVVAEAPVEIAEPSVQAQEETTTV